MGLFAKDSTMTLMLDATDRRILAVLQKEGRITNADLSERVNLSPSACHRRVQQLEEAGYIDKYVALLNTRKMGKPTTVFVEITLQSQAEDLLDAFGAGAGHFRMSPDGGDGRLPFEDHGRRHRRFRPHPPPASQPPARRAADAIILCAADCCADHGAGGLG